jgi:plasmid stabilization system protein ParE
VKPVLHPEADEEFAEGVRYYAEIDPKIGERFYGEIERLIHEACADPQRFGKFDPPVRRHFSHWFPYAVIYLEESDCLWIVAVMHMKRRPGYWKPCLASPL